MTKTRCRAKNQDTCRVHGTAFVSTIDINKGEFKDNPANNFSKSLNESKIFTLLLSNAEQEAVRDYCEQGYTDINRHLHGSKVNESLNPQVSLIQSALGKFEMLPKAAPKVLYRATRTFEKEFGDSNEAEEYMKKRFPVGGIVSFDGFTSTTPNPVALFDFMQESYEDVGPSKGMFGVKNSEDYKKLHDGINPGLSNVVYEIQTSKAVPVSALGDTYAEKEQEYLLNRNKKFKVVEVIPNAKLNNPKEHWLIKSRHATIVRLVEVTD